MANNPIAPNGKPSNLSAEQYALVRTPEFKAWFGDWENDPQNASKVVDDNGEPMVVYHGTEIKSINAFNPTSYFAENYSYAKVYGLGLQYSDDMDDDEYDELINSGKENVYKVFLNIKNPLTADRKLFADNFTESPKVKKALEDGYDGMVNTIPTTYFPFDKEEERQFLTFNERQIKLADGSNTTFDAANPDIRYADGGKTGQEITCINCGWHWNTSDSDESDKYVCHKCGFDNKAFYDPEPIGVMADGGAVGVPSTENLIQLVVKERENKIREWYRMRYRVVVARNDGYSYKKESERDSEFIDAKNPSQKKILDIIKKNPDVSEIRFNGTIKVGNRVGEPLEIADDFSVLLWKKESYADGGVAEFNKKNQDRVKEIKEDYKYDGSEKDLSYVNSNVAVSYLQYLADSIGEKYYQWDWENESLMPTNYFQIMMQLEGGNILRALFVYVDDNHIVVKSKSNVKLLDEDYNTIKVLVEEPKFKSSMSEYSFEYRGITFEINRFDRKWMFFGKHFGYLQNIPQLEAKSKNELIIKIKRYLDVVLEYKEKDNFAKGGLSKTPAPKKDRVFGSDKNKVGSAASKESAKKINLSEDIITTLSNKSKEYNEENSGNKVTLNTLKAVMRRGMGAYSTSHRPTITGGAPNSRQAWGFARVNKFLKKKSGEKVKAAYVQDDDLLEMGGTINKNNLKMIQQHYHSMKPIEDIQVGDIYVIKEDMFAPHQDHEHPQHLSTRYATVEVKSPCHRNLDSYTLEVMDCDCDNAAGRYAKGKVIERSRKHILSSGKLKSAVAKATEFKDGGELNADSQEVKEYFAHDSGNAGGLLVGKRHSEGGIKADVKSTGQQIEMEGGEAVITRGAVNSKKKYVYEGKDMTTREILSDLNVKGGGVAFADGGDVPEKMNCGCSSMKVGGISYTPQDFITLSEKEYQEHRLIDGIEKERTDHFYTLAKLNSGAISIEQALREIASKEMMIDPKYPYSE